MSEAAQGEGTGVRPTGQFGMFVFLASEGLLFGALILTYVALRITNQTAFAAGASEVSLLAGTANTAILLSSSYAAALATIWAKTSDRHGSARLALGVTAALGVVFLVIKGLEYWDEAARGLLPFRDPSLAPPFARVADTRPFFDIYLALTGTHALHLLTGVLLLSWLALFWRRLERPGHVVELCALYWHFIDLVWVILFPLLYLVR